MDNVSNNIMDIAAADISDIQQKQIEELNNARAAAATGAQLTPEQIAMIQRYAKQVQKVREYKVYRNDPCPCGSGKKYKNCCLSSGKYENLVNA